MTWDMAIMLPLMEMAGERHFFVRNITYIYNDSNPINDHKVNKILQSQLASLIRLKPRYQRLEQADIAVKKTKKMYREL